MKIQLFSLIILAISTIIACAPSATTEDEESASPDYAAFDSKVNSIRAFISAHSAENLDDLKDMLADTLQWSPPWYNGNEWLGKDEYVTNLQNYHNDYDNIQFQEGIINPDTTFGGWWSGSVFPKESATSEPNNIRIYGTWTGTHTASQTEVGVKWFALCILNHDGQITNLSEYFDVHGIAAQVAAAESAQE